MTQEMEEFEKLLKMDVPAPDADAKKATLLRGLEAFDKEFPKNTQGITSSNRLMDAVRIIHNTFLGGHTMKPRHIIAGSFVVVFGLALINSSSLTPLIPGFAYEEGSMAALKADEKTVTSPHQSSSAVTPGALALAPAADPEVGNYNSRASTSYQITDGSAAPDASKLPPPPAVADTTLENVMRQTKKEAGSGGYSTSKDTAVPEKPKDFDLKENYTEKDFDENLKNRAFRNTDEIHFNVPNKSDVAASSKVKRPEPEEKKPSMPSSVPPAPPPQLKGAINGAGAAMPVGRISPMDSATSDQSIVSYHDEGRDKFEHVKANPLKVTKEEPVSTFSVDVDTSSYSFMRASLNNNVLPQKDAVRIEELVNYFPYQYQGPESKETPFKANVAVMPTPWNSKTKLIHIGIKGYDIEQKEKPRANLVFLVDTSGSMDEPNKLPLLKNSLKLLLDSLKPEDSVAIVTYAGSAGIALEPTSVKEKGKILAAIESFNAGGSTAGAEGIRTAYQLAERSFNKEGVNRVILATDGDFNVGITNQEELKSFIERERDTGIFLSVLGFGRGNYNDAMMQTLAQNGNGNAAYIDNLSEARKALVEEAGSTLFTIAKDVKIQVEFNPAQVSEYHLIGYETRILNREDFNNDKVDAGDIGSGHTVTALYEIVPTGSDAKLVDELRYQKPEEAKEKPADTGEYAFVKIRYKLPDSDTSKLITTPVDNKVEFKDLPSAPQEARFATAVAAYGQLLRGDAFIKSYSYDDVITLAQAAKGADEFGYRAEFINLVRLASSAAKLERTERNHVMPDLSAPR